MTVFLSLEIWKKGQYEFDIRASFLGPIYEIKRYNS